MISNRYSITSRQFFNPNLGIILLLWAIIILAGCKKDDGPDPQDPTEAKLMNQVVGTYLVEGLYDMDILDKREITIIRKGNSELEISGDGFPTFKIMDLLIGYQNDKDPDEYIIFSETVGPNDGTVTFSFPEKEILISVTLKIDATTKRTLALTGIKR